MKRANRNRDLVKRVFCWQNFCYAEFPPNKKSPPDNLTILLKYLQLDKYFGEFGGKKTSLEFLCRIARDQIVITPNLNCNFTQVFPPLWSHPLLMYKHPMLTEWHKRGKDGERQTARDHQTLPAPETWPTFGVESVEDDFQPVYCWPSEVPKLPANP